MYSVVWKFFVVQLSGFDPEENKPKYGGVAQLGEHLPCKQGVKGSIPFISTNFDQHRKRCRAKLLKLKVARNLTTRPCRVNGSIPFIRRDKRVTDRISNGRRTIKPNEKNRSVAQVARARA